MVGMNTAITYLSRFMKRLLVGVAIGVFASALACSVVRAEPSSTQKPEASANIGQRISSAGRVRLQAQRIAKLYLQIRKGLNGDVARSQLSSAIAQVDSDLNSLSRYSGNEKTRPTLARLSEVWADMKGTIAKTPYTMERMNLVNILAEDLTIASGKLAMQIERDGTTPNSRLLDLSLRQSMLVQRLARLYMMAYFGDKSVGLQVDIEQTQKEFSMALNELVGARGNTPVCSNALELAKLQWVFFGLAIDGLRNGEGSNPDHVAVTAEGILEALDTVANQYVQEHLSSGKDPIQLTRTSTRTR
jgi:hypothetical protein